MVYTYRKGRQEICPEKNHNDRAGGKRRREKCRHFGKVG